MHVYLDFLLGYACSLHRLLDEIFAWGTRHAFAMKFIQNLSLMTWHFELQNRKKYNYMRLYIFAIEVSR